MRFKTVEEIIPTDPAAITHAPEDPSLVVQIDGSVEFGDVAGVHDENAIVSESSTLVICKE